MKWLGLIFAVIVAITYGIVFNTVQSNSIVDAVGASFDIDGSNNFMFSAIAGLVIAVGAYAIFVGGAKRISSVSAYLVPIMAGLYLIVGIIVVALNIGAVPGMIGTIFSDAFNMHSIAGGSIGSIMLVGVQRGLFSNEAGIGSVPNAAATASASHPAKRGFVQSLGVYFDTILVCSITAFTILLSNPEYGSSAEGVQMTQTALSGQLGQWAIHFLTFAIFLFAFSSILGNYYYGEANIEHLTRGRMALRIYQVIVMVAVFVGAIAALDIVWTAANLFMAIMALINLFALLMLSPLVFSLLKNYMNQRRAGQEPIFRRADLSSFKHINTEVEAWDDTDEVTTTAFWESRGKNLRQDPVRADGSTEEDAGGSVRAGQHSSSQHSSNQRAAELQSRSEKACLGHGVEVELAEAAPRAADPESVNASQKLGFKELAQIVEFGTEQWLGVHSLSASPLVDESLVQAGRRDRQSRATVRTR